MIPCNTCGTGELKRKKKYRMSPVVVLIGYIILLPSILGMAIGGLTLAATGEVTVEAIEETRVDAENRLQRAGIPPALITKVVDSQAITAADRAGLSQEQLRILDEVDLQVVASNAGTGIGAAMAGGFSVFLILSSFVGGLLGWLLVMKKKVLQCTSCQAVVAAS